MRPYWLAAGLAGLSAAACAPTSAPVASVKPETGRFYNPVIRSRAAPDPWLIQKDGWYYLTFTTGGGIQVRRSRTLTGLDHGEKRTVWTPPATGPNCCHIWSPQIRFVRGKWYIYYTADSGENKDHRMFVLEAKGDDPLGPYTEKARIYDPQADYWGIFGDVLEHDGRLYALWSGWPTLDAKFPQNTYIAPMRDPWTLAGPRVAISTPDQPWERTVEPIQEGPITLRRGRDVFIVYSGDASWTPAYKLGVLRFKGGGIMRPENWEKSGPVFSGVPGAYGPGGASFVKSPDGREDWMIYHATTRTTDGWKNRTARIQRFGWNPDGTPRFGEPAPLAAPLPLPSGDPGHPSLASPAAAR